MINQQSRLAMLPTLGRPGPHVVTAARTEPDFKAAQRRRCEEWDNEGGGLLPDCEQLIPDAVASAREPFDPAIGGFWLHHILPAGLSAGAFGAMVAIAFS